MENKDELKQLASIPYVAYESALQKAERRDKRNFIIILVLVILLVASNIGWLVYESQFEDVTTTSTEQEVVQDAENGNNSFVGGDYGISKD